MTLLSAQKSTTVRSIRATLRSADLVAPGLAARVATRRWFTVPPAPPDHGVPDGGEPFEVPVRGSVVRGRTWGDGPVVYLVHGWGGRGSQMSGLVQPLLAHGLRPVVFDALSHGSSDPGALGVGAAHGGEFAAALGRVAEVFGPAKGVVAHSLGSIATLIALRSWSVETDRLAFVAPMNSYAAQVAAFQDAIGIGPRARRRMDRTAGRLVGLPVHLFDVRLLAAGLPSRPTLVVHDRADRQTPFADSVALVNDLPDARLVATNGLGHRRILRDPGVVAEVTGFLAAAGRDEKAARPRSA